MLSYANENFDSYVHDDFDDPQWCVLRGISLNTIMIIHISVGMIWQFFFIFNDKII